MAISRSQMKKTTTGTPKKSGKFPDLTGDGKVTKADILKGRGIKLAKGRSVMKAKGGSVMKAKGGTVMKLSSGRKIKGKRGTQSGKADVNPLGEKFVQKLYSKSKGGAIKTKMAKGGSVLKMAKGKAVMKMSKGRAVRKPKK